MISRLVAVLGFLPAMTGPLPRAETGMRVTVCSALGARTVEIPLPRPSREDRQPPHPAVCHAVCSRHRTDPAQ